MLTYDLATARAWAEIDVDKLLSNYRGALLELSPGVRHYTVLKANAYGLGAVPIAKILYGEGGRLFAAACVLEAVELKNALPPDADVLVMGETMPPEIPLALSYGIVSTVSSYEGARLLSERAAQAGQTARFHCKVDTGLHRLGFSLEEATDAIARLLRLPAIRFEGLYSHLQRRSTAFDRLQAKRLVRIRDELTARGVMVPMLHLLDSIGMWRYPEYQFDAVRGAAFLFGYTPQDYPRPENIQFALSLKTRIVRIHDAQAGECLGYGCEHPLKRHTRAATLCIGYADGYPRAMSHVGEAEVHGRRAKVIGVVCMDLVMVDVTDIPEARVGDIVTMLGGSIGIFEYAGFSGGYHNEYISLLSRRVPRVYVKAGKPIDIEGYLP
ncbi:MAG: alanine racemase [Firmicutes bacterium]|nr:alanine racemase [Bacillota bacterium]